MTYMRCRCMRDVYNRVTIYEQKKNVLFIWSPTLARKTDRRYDARTDRAVDLTVRRQVAHSAAAAAAAAAE